MPTVRDGECMVSIAHRLGFRDYRTVYDDAANGTLKTNRPNPNALVVGDDVKIPDKKTKFATKAVDSTWTFVVKTKKPVKFRIVLLDTEHKHLADKDWKLAGSKTVSGKTGADGLVELTDIPPLETDAVLTVQLGKPAVAKAAAAAAATGNPTYPPKIAAAEFLDPAPDERKVTSIAWTLKIGSLPSHNVKQGVQARLNNLGFACDAGSPDPATARAVKAYQRIHLAQKRGSGAAADIEGDIKDRHDKTP